MFKFDIPATAVPKGSRRSGTRKDGSRYSYESNPAVPVFMRLAKLALVKQAAEQRHTTYEKAVPLVLRVAFVVERPKNPSYDYPPQGDTDKRARAICDVLQAAGVIADDTQIVRLEAEKMYGAEARTYGYVAPR